MNYVWTFWATQIIFIVNNLMEMMSLDMSDKPLEKYTLFHSLEENPRLYFKSTIEYSHLLWPFLYIFKHILSRYVEQLVASAEAAVEEVIRRGVSSKFLYKLNSRSTNDAFNLDFLCCYAYLGCSSKQDCCWRTFLWCIHDCKPFGSCPSSFLLWNCSFWGLQQNTYTFWFSGIRA